MSTESLNIAFLHPDLGIGGAERLVVDAAIGLQQLGHTCIIYTSHHDPLHSFIETNDGSLHIVVIGDESPRSIYGRGMILCASLRSLYLSLCVSREHDVYVVDQISLPVLVLSLLTSKRILFYCHFPDKLLAKRDSLLKRVYRLPFDLFEEFAMGFADEIAVNSKFTRGVFKRAFWSIRRDPRVVYPAINFASFDGKVDTTHVSVRPLVGKRFILSINRFERKKEIELAVKAFASVSRIYPDLLLIVAGGFDPRVVENVEYLEELITLAASLTLFPRVFKATNDIYPSRIDQESRVVFIPSFTALQKRFLLSISDLLVYTPSNEHFGIVPVEAMYARLPVVAARSGGPLESVGEGCGVLVDATEDGFCEGMMSVLRMSQEERDGMRGREHVEMMFGLGRFSGELDGILRGMDAKGRRVKWFLCVSLLVLALSIILLFF